MSVRVSGPSAFRSAFGPVNCRPGRAQPFHQLTVALLTEELPDRFGHLRAHLADFLQGSPVLRAAIASRLPKCRGQHLRRPLADKRNAEAVEHARERLERDSIDVLDDL